jgi:hypothetical protein
MGNGQSFTENEGNGATETHRSRLSHLHRSDVIENISEEDEASYDVVSLAEQDHALTIKRNDIEIENCTTSHDEKNVSSGSSANPSSSSPTTSYTRYSQTNSVVTFEDDDLSSSIDDTSFSKSNSIFYDTDEATAMTDMAHDGDDERTKQQVRQNRRTKWSAHLRNRREHSGIKDIDGQYNEAETEEETILILDAEEEFSRCSSNNLACQRSVEAIPTVLASDVALVAGIGETFLDHQQTEESLTDKENSKDCDDEDNFTLLVHGIQGVPVESNPNQKSSESVSSLQNILRTYHDTERALSSIEENSLRKVQPHLSYQKGMDPVGMVLSGLNAEPNRNRNAVVPSSDTKQSLARNITGNASVSPFDVDIDSDSNRNIFIVGLSPDPCHSQPQNSETKPSEAAFGFNKDAEPNRNRNIAAHSSATQRFSSQSPVDIASISSPEIAPTKESVELRSKRRSDVDIIDTPLCMPNVDLKTGKNHNVVTNAELASQIEHLPIVKAQEENNRATIALSAVVAGEVKELEAQVANAFALSDANEVATIDRVVVVDASSRPHESCYLRETLASVEPVFVEENFKSSSMVKASVFGPPKASVTDNGYLALDINAYSGPPDLDFVGERQLNMISSAPSLDKKKPTSPKPEDQRNRSVFPKKDCSDDKILTKSTLSGSEEDFDLLLVKEYDDVFCSLMVLNPDLMIGHPTAMEIIRIAKLQKILTLTLEVESELQEYVQTLNEQKLEMTSHYHTKLLEASKKNASREFYLQGELGKKKIVLFDFERRSSWDVLHHYRQLCIQYNTMQHFLLQHIADANDPLAVLPESLAGNKKLLLDTMLSSKVSDHSSRTGLENLRRENAILSHQALVLERELVSLEQKTTKTKIDCLG